MPPPPFDAFSPPVRLRLPHFLPPPTGCLRRDDARHTPPRRVYITAHVTLITMLHYATSPSLAHRRCYAIIFIDAEQSAMRVIYTQRFMRYATRYYYARRHGERLQYTHT